MQSLTRQTLKIFWQHAKKYTWQPYVLFFSMIAVTLLRDIPPLLYSRLITLVAESPTPASFRPAVIIIATIFAINAFRIAVWRGINFLNNFFQPRVMADLVRTCYEYLQRHSIGFFNSSFIGSLVTKVKRYERAFEQISDQVFYNLGRSLVEMFIIVGILFWRNHLLGGIMLGWCFSYMVMVYFFARYKLPFDIKRAHADTRTTAQLADTLTNNFNIKIYSRYPLEFSRFASVTDSQFRARKKSGDLGNIAEIFQSFYMISLEFGLMYLALHLWQTGQIAVGDIALVQAYILRIFDQLWDTGKNIRTIYEATADANEMTEMLIEPHEIADAPGAKELKVKKGEIVFNNISFAYKEGVEVMQNFNLHVKAGERVALIGPSGGGKSTIVKLLLRFHDLNSGKITIDGQDIAKVTQDSLRESLSLVPQEPILFHRTLMENIRYGKLDASDEEVMQAADKAHAHEFINAFPLAYETYVGERGVKLSGGERQRVAIARAILKNAPILILDEATSSLDSESEMYIQDSLKELMSGKTVIVIAHRLSTIMQMDRIVVIDGGRIVEEGKHQELIKAKQGVYQKLWGIQAGGFMGNS